LRVDADSIRCDVVNGQIEQRRSAHVPCLWLRSHCEPLEILEPVLEEGGRGEVRTKNPTSTTGQNPETQRQCQLKNRRQGDGSKMKRESGGEKEKKRKEKKGKKRREEEDVFRRFGKVPWILNTRLNYFNSPRRVSKPGKVPDLPTARPRPGNGYQMERPCSVPLQAERVSFLAFFGAASQHYTELT